MNYAQGLMGLQGLFPSLYGSASLGNYAGNNPGMLRAQGMRAQPIGWGQTMQPFTGPNIPSPLPLNTLQPQTMPRPLGY